MFAADIGLQSGLGFLVAALAARSVPVASFGDFAFVLALAGMLQTLAYMGMPALVYGRAGRRPDRRSRIVGHALVVSTAAGVGLYALPLVLFSIAGAMDLLVLSALAGIRVLSAPASSLIADLQARNSIRELLGIRVFTFGFGFAAATAAFIQGGSLAWFAAVWGLEPFLYGLALVLLQNAQGRLVFSSHPRYGTYIAKAFPLAMQSVFVMIYLRFDQVYVKLRFGEVALGTYAAAAKLAEVANLALVALVLFLAPRLIRELTAGSMSRATRGALFGVGIATCLAVFLCARFGGDLLTFSFGIAYSGGADILAAYLASSCFVFFSSLGARALAARSITWIQFTSGAYGAISNIVLSVLLGEMWGLVGVAVATVLSYALVAAIVWSPLVIGQRVTA